MITPKEYVEAYVNLKSPLYKNDNWNLMNTPIVKYLQNGKKPQSDNAQAAKQKLLTHLGKFFKHGQPPQKFKLKGYQHPGLTDENYDYLLNSITRTFLGKACPWEIQETIQLASLFGLVDESYCEKNLGVDCGGFVANYWGEACPHMTDPMPLGWDGISPRNFWEDGSIWSDAKKRRRKEAKDISIGDAAIFFTWIDDKNVDTRAKSDGQGGHIKGTGSKAFHIGLVNDIGVAGDNITKLEIAESSGESSRYGGNGVNVRFSKVLATGKSQSFVYLKAGEDERIYFVAPPRGAGSELPYDYSK
jgi:hypothetical protein